VATTDGTGVLKSETIYDAFGNVQETTGQSANKFGYTGHQMDAESGLIYFQARYYDPQIGRFITQDPFEGDWQTPLSKHHYLYAYGNPTVYVDLHGYMAVPMPPPPVAPPVGNQGMSPSLDQDGHVGESDAKKIARAWNKMWKSDDTAAAPEKKIAGGSTSPRATGGQFTEADYYSTRQLEIELARAHAVDLQKQIDGATNKEDKAWNKQRLAEYRERYGDLLIRPQDTRKPTTIHENPGNAGVRLGPLEGKPIHQANGPQHTGNTRPERQKNPIIEGAPIGAPPGPSVMAQENSSPNGGAKEETTRVRHYTDRKGSKGIEEANVIGASDHNRVYVEPANRKPLSQLDAEEKYELGRNKGRDYVETDVPNSRLEWVKNPRYGTKELTVRGDLPLINPSFTRRK
jgi:RHS repeat-associated protein